MSADERPRRGCPFGCLAVPLLVGGLLWALFLSFPWSSGKYDPATVQGRPSALPTVIAAERQTEPHTCGLHSLRSVYRAYGLDPVARELRFRLGVDRPGVPYDHSTLGTIHPDLFRVAIQDGLHLCAVGDPADAHEELRVHLAGGHPALLLIRVRGSGNLHWVVTDRLEGDRLRIHDSLADGSYEMAAAQFLADHCLSVLLVAPATEPADTAGAHAAGLAEIRAVSARLDD